MIVNVSRTSRWWAAGLAVTLAAVLTIVGLVSYSNHGRNSTPATLFGTLDPQTSTAATEKKDGISVAMFELNWASFEPSQGVFNASYMATMRSYLQAFRAGGMRVTLGLGLEDTPSWVFGLPDGRYVNEHGDNSAEADFVYSAAVRQAAAAYLAKVAADLPLSDFWAIRLTSGGDLRGLRERGHARRGPGRDHDPQSLSPLAAEPAGPVCRPNRPVGRLV